MAPKQVTLAQINGEVNPHFRARHGLTWFKIKGRL